VGSDIENGKYYKYVCITTNQPESELNPNPTTKQLAAVNI